VCRMMATARVRCNSRAASTLWVAELPHRRRKLKSKQNTIIQQFTIAVTCKPELTFMYRTPRAVHAFRFTMLVKYRLVRKTELAGRWTPR
jgi:hypothetical protein